MTWNHRSSNVLSTFFYYVPGEVECPIQQQQQYRYMNSEAGTLHRAKPLEDSVTDGHLWPSNNDKKVATIERQPVDIGWVWSQAKSKKSSYFENVISHEGKRAAS